MVLERNWIETQQIVQKGVKSSQICASTFRFVKIIYFCSIALQTI